MKVKLVCKQCGKEYEVPHWRKETSKFCSRECQRIHLTAKPNVICAICGKPFHLKQSHIDRYKAKLGFCCSRDCNREQMRIRMSGDGNHQYGLRGHLNASFKQGIRTRKNNNITEMMYYVGDWYKKKNENGRITYHRYLVELNHDLFCSDYFENIDDWFYLKEFYQVHHIDGDHSNNDVNRGG